MTHPSSSKAQVRAETIIRAEASRVLGCTLEPRRLRVVGGTYVDVDGVSDDPRTLVEIYARVGTLRGGQIKKIAEDILKLTTVRKCNDEWTDANAYLVYASQEARDSIRGWLDAAATAWGVQSLVITLPEDVRADLLRAQATQVMINRPTSQLRS